MADVPWTTGMAAPSPMNAACGTLVGYHDDGGLKPTRFESYAEFQRRIASR
jgi:hypothetical protein